MLREALADLEHEQWAHWMRYMLSLGSERVDGTWAIDMEHIRRWQRQMDTPYADLSEKEKDSDREWADKALDYVRGAVLM